MTATLDTKKAAQTYTIDKMHSEVALQVRHLLTKVRGRFTEFAGTVAFDQREDGASVDQILLSPAAYLASSPGPPKHDTTLFRPTRTPR